MKLFQVFGYALLRKLGYIAAVALVALAVSFFGVGRASAHDHPCQNPGNTTCDQGDAVGAARDVSAAIPHCEASTPGMHEGDGGWHAKLVSVNGGNETPSGSVSADYEWQNGTGGVLACGPDAFYYGTDCASRNASLGVPNYDRSLGYGRGAEDQCRGGCKWKLVSDEKVQTLTFSFNGQQPAAHTRISGLWEFTGQVCPNDVPAKPKEPEAPKTDCTPSVGGVSYCTVPQDGKQCMTMSDGRYGCWAPAETGQKTDGPITQNKAPGETSPPAPEGSSKTGQVTNNTTTNNTTTTTNIANYTTNNGSPAGPSNQGTPSGTDGKPGTGAGGTGGTGGGGTGTDPGDENTGASSGDCGAAPLSTGDALLGAILKQEWETGCKVEKLGGKLEGDPNCNDGGVVAFACSGNQLLCKQTLTALEAKCQALDAKNRILSDADKDQGNAGGNGEGDYWSDGDGIGQLNGSLISVGGSGEFIPVMSLNGRAVDLNGPIGNMLAILKLLIIAACSAAAAFIAGGRD